MSQSFWQYSVYIHIPLLVFLLCSGNKDTILVLMHHTRNADYPAIEIAWSQLFSNVIMHVDVLFHESEAGLLKCQTNENAIQQIRKKLQKCKNITKSTNTVEAQGLRPADSQISVKSNTRSIFNGNCNYL